MSKRTVLRAAMYMLIAANVTFIWSMSVYSRSASTVQSDGVIGFLGQLFPFIAKIDHDVIELIVRKLAHFSEFASLGALSALILWEHTDRVRTDVFFALTAPVLMMCLAVASTDETIQLFTGRGSMVADVILDFSGAVFGFFAIAAVRAFVFMKKHSK